MKKKFAGILFDLDGTLFDTLPDIAFSINKLRASFALPPLALEALRPIISLGSRPLIKKAFEIDETHHHFNELRENFLTIYENNIAHNTHFFPGMEEVLDMINHNETPWGIVTNKLTRHATSLITELMTTHKRLKHKPQCLVCGDTLPTYKPDPGPILHACELLKIDPTHSLYVGDSITDIEAGNKAGATSILALYGYLSTEEDPTQWGAQGYLNTPKDLLALMA